MPSSPSSPASARAYWTIAPRRGEIRLEDLQVPAAGQVLVETLYSGVSRGTERMVFAGEVPQSEWARMRAPHQGGEFPFPVKYGYAAVGRVLEGSSDLKGRTVFALHPHQDRFVLPGEAVFPLPDHISPARGVLAANMETALNALWDSGAAPGDRIAVVGAGAVGALVAFLAGRLPGAETTLIDVDPGRAALARQLGVGFALPADAPGDADVVFHASGRGEGLRTALSLAGDEARIVELSWYGDSDVTLALGGAFHSGRLTLASSQVGRVSPGHRLRWSHRRRLAKAVDLLASDCLDALLGPPVRFADLPDRMDELLKSRAPCPLVVYD
ncbi:zinc-dependent alcohol dehydrogenase [Ancylobacter terrae]|uniref:zinc-dependent alcohol dehydrogenase n=1 Tax=Ancylobacter sp. sgz301288 TaxID=3342077 RepID=UPI00385B9CC5